MKRTIILSMAALVSFAACQKENTPAQQETKTTVLSATVEQQTGDTKTALGSGNTVVWSEKDSVQVWNGDTGTNTPFVLTQGAGTTQGVFFGDEIVNPQYAFYPSSAVTGVSGSEATFTLPAVQHYVKNSFDNGANVAVAQISGNNMAFKNICGALKLQLKGTTRVKTITITGKSNEKLNGTYTVDASASTPDMSCTTTEVDSEKSVTLDCGNGVLLDPTTAKNFYIVIPKGAFAKGFTITINDVFSASENIVAQANTIARNTIKSMPERSCTIKGVVLPGKFSVSASKQVRFSQGYLIATLDASGNPTDWKFADQQYDILLKSGIGVYAGDLDMFGFSTDGVGASSGYKPWGINASQTDTDYSGAFVDWGTNSVIVSKYGVGLYTLSDSEWAYLTTQRKASTINEVANARYAYFIIDGIRGLLLFPDTFVWNTTTMGPVPAVINEVSSTWNEIDYSFDQFDAIEQAGGVFLANSGYRVANQVMGYYNEGCVMSSTGNGDWYSGIKFRFDSFVAGRPVDLYHCAHPVRLVLKAE